MRFSFTQRYTIPTDGKQLLENFLVHIAGIHQDWTSDSFVDATVQELKEKLGNDKVVLGLSGGVNLQ